MAAASIVLLNSSSPASYQPPPVTPPAEQYQTGILISSSPGLISPSNFIKPRAPALKSGSRVQQAPDGIAVGFAKASSVWKLKQLEEEKQRDEGRAEQNARVESVVKESKTSIGKLAKPKKASLKVKAVNSALEKGLDEYAFVEVDEPKQRKRTIKTSPRVTEDGQKSAKQTRKTSKRPKEQLPVLEKKVLGEYIYMDTDAPKSVQAAEKAVPEPMLDTTEQLPPMVEPGQVETVSLSKYFLDVPGQPPDLKDPVDEPLPKQKQPRKKARNAKDGFVTAPAKQPRKRKMKSESIILNSDEPEPITESALARDSLAVVRPQDSEVKQNGADAKAGSITLQDAETEQCEMNLPKIDSECSNQGLHDDQDPSRTISEQSNYFANAAGNCDSKEETVPIETPIGDSPAVPLPVTSRRRNWTPVKEHRPVDTEQQRPPTADSGSSEPTRQLADILGEFGYVSNEMGTHTAERSATGEAMTKRRRLDLSALIPLGVNGQREETTADISPPKPLKQKKGRKKPQTITALATAPFQSAKDIVTVEGTISHFFSPGKDCVNEQAAEPEQPKTKATKPRKSRKLKDKSTTTATDRSTKQKKPAKAKQVKVKFNEAEHRSKLYSPGRAAAQLQRQGFLFGTSSQLALDEPASFIRDMQVAIRQSEFHVESETDGAPMSSQSSFPRSPRSPQGKNYIKVPTAPHGTYLSLEQARRELWCLSSRDAQGVVLTPEDAVITARCSVAGEGTEHPEITATEPMLEAVVNGFELIRDAEPQIDLQHVVVDLCDTSPISIPQALDAAGVGINAPEVDQKAIEDTGLPLVVQDANDTDDWMFIQSSSPPPAMQPRAISPEPCVRLRSGDLTILSPRRFRPALSPLNPNAMIMNSWSPGKTIPSGQMRPLSSSAADQARQSRSKSPSGRGPGRPRKDAANDSFSPTPAKRRGRPPKLKTLASEPLQLSKPKRQKTAPSASQPIDTAGWVNIDDIYDSDSPTTPSPPRRRATSSPPAVQPLTLSRSIQAQAPALAASTLKSKDTSWESNRIELFTRITTSVKSAPPFNNGNKPSWYEKMLLYDPIVLEDLTAWLNEQGLRVEVQKRKPKAKKRGRKRKDAEPELDEEEWEAHEELLQAWMVQKWCEEKSVCCLWREGLRGGVRTRY